MPTSLEDWQTNSLIVWINLHFFYFNKLVVTIFINNVNNIINVVAIFERICNWEQRQAIRNRIIINATWIIGIASIVGVIVGSDPNLGLQDVFARH